MKDGAWSVLKYGKLKQTSAKNYNKATSNNGGRHQNLLAKKLNKFTRKMFGQEDEGNSSEGHLRILDSDVNKTKERLTDRRNAIEFFRRHPYDSPMSSIYSGSSSASSIVSFSSSDESDFTGN